MVIEVCYTADGIIYVPDHRISRLDASMTTKPLRGYKFVQAVLQNNKCIGYICIEDLQKAS